MTRRNHVQRHEQNDSAGFVCAFAPPSDDDGRNELCLQSGKWNRIGIVPCSSSPGVGFNPLAPYGSDNRMGRIPRFWGCFWFKIFSGPTGPSDDFAGRPRGARHADGGLKCIRHLPPPTAWVSCAKKIFAAGALIFSIKIKGNQTINEATRGAGRR
jgi:hypothetical protein